MFSSFSYVKRISLSCLFHITSGPKLCHAICILATVLIPHINKTHIARMAQNILQIPPSRGGTQIPQNYPILGPLSEQISQFILQHCYGNPAAHEVHPVQFLQGIASVSRVVILNKSAAVHHVNVTDDAKFFKGKSDNSFVAIFGQVGDVDGTVFTSHYYAS